MAKSSIPILSRHLWIAFNYTIWVIVLCERLVLTGRTGRESFSSLNFRLYTHKIQMS